MNVRRNNQGKIVVPPDLVKNALDSFQSSIPNQDLSNFRSYKKKCKRGVRVYSNNGRFTGRLPSQGPSGNDPTKFVTNGKRMLDGEDRKESPEEKTTKKRRVAFEDNFSSKPIETIVETPAKDLETHSSKRKATPFKPLITPANGMEEDEKESEQKVAPSSERRSLRVRRSPQSGRSPDMDFPEMLQVSLDGSSWLMPDNSIEGTGNMMIDDDFMTGFLPAEGFVNTDMPSGLPQFEQAPLFLGEKKDRTVPEDDDDDDDDDVPAARTKVDCSGIANTNVNEGWGDLFAHLAKTKQCSVCLAPNPLDAVKCKSCEAVFPSEDGEKSESAGTSKPAASGLAGTKATAQGSIGNSGFAFSGGENSKGKISAGGFSFGGQTIASTTTAPSSTAGGFKFGGESANAAPAAAPSPAAGGFKFGGKSENAAPVAAPSAAAGGFKFGASSTKTSSTTVSSSPGGFKFGASSTTAASKPSVSAETSTTTGGFKFGSTNSSTESPPRKSAPSVDSTKVKTPKFSFGSSASAPEAGSASSSAAPSATGLFGGFAASAPSNSTSVPAFKFGANTATVSASKRGAAKVSAAEPVQKRKNLGADSGGGFSFGSSQKKDTESKQDGQASTTAKAPEISFGSSSDTNSSAPTDSGAASNFKFGASFGATKTETPSLGSVPTVGKDDGKTKKKRRSPDDANTVSSTQPSSLFGSAPEPVAAPAPSPGFNFGSTPAPAPAAAPTPASSFSFGSATSAPAVAPSPAAGFSFGSTTPAPAPTTASTPAPMFGSTAPPSAAPTPAASFNFGSTTPAPAPAPSGAPAFGGFGSTPAPAPAPSATPAFGGFGSTPAPAPAPSATPAFGGFGSTPAPVAAPTAPQGFGGFGSTPAPAAAPSVAPAFGGFGSTPAPVAAPPAPQGFGGFGSTPAPAAAPNGAAGFGGFGAPPAPAPMAPGGFGNSGFGAPPQPQAPPNAGGGFNIGSSGNASRTPGRGRRRIVRARRPK